MKIVLKLPIKYQEKNNKFRTEIPNTDFLGIPTKYLVTD